jgi:autotransporter-associated beta strand protein
VGNLTITGTNIWQAGTTYAWQIADFGGTAGTGWDLLTVNGVLSNTSIASGSYTINIAGAVGGSATNFSSSANYSMVIASASGMVTNWDVSAYTLNTAGFGNFFDGVFTLSLTNNGQDLVLNYKGEENFTWKDVTGDFSNPANWVAGVVPPTNQANVAVYFGGSAGAYIATNDLNGLLLKLMVLTNQNMSVTQTIMGNPLNFANALAEVRQEGSSSVLILSDVIISNSTTFAGSGTGTLTIGGDVTGTANKTIVKAGNWTLVLSGVNTGYLGSVTNNAGTITLASATALTGANRVHLGSNGILHAASDVTIGALTGTGTAIISNNVELAVNVNISGAAFSGSLAGEVDSTLVKTGVQNWVLSGNNTNFLGNTIVKQGTLTLANSNAVGSGSITVGDIAGATLALTNNITFTNAITVAGIGGTLSSVATGDSYITGSVALSNSANFAAISGGTLTFTGVISGNSGFTKINAGTVVLSNNNTYAGQTFVNAGTLVVSATGSLPTNNNVNVASTGTLDLRSATPTLGGLAGAGTVLLQPSATLTNGVANTTTTFSGIITGSGANLIKAGTGTFTVNGASTYTGETKVEGGTLVIAGMVPLTGTSPIGTGTGTGAGTVKVGDPTGAIAAQLLMSGGNTFSRNVEVVAGSGGLAGVGGTGAGTNVYSSGVTLNTNAFLVAGTGGRTRFDGVITGSGGVTTRGGGVIELTQNNTYTGGTIVSNATLVANNTSGWATGDGLTRVVNSGVLAGSGFISNSVIEAGGRVSPGSAITASTLTLDTTEWQEDGRYEWTLLDGSLQTDLGAGINWDFISASNLTLTATASNPFVIDINNIWTNAINFSITSSVTNTFLIASTTNGVFDASVFSVSYLTATNGWGWAVTTSLDGNNLYLNYGFGLGSLLVPEPHVVGLLMVGGIITAAFRKRLRKKNQRR